MISRSLLTSLVFVLFTGILSAQITVTNDVFPEVGDTLFTSTVLMTAGLDVGAEGPDQAWDFSAYQTNMVDLSIVKDASTGSAFDQFMSAEVLIDFLAGEGYVDVTNTQFTLIGYSGQDPLGFGISILSDFDPGQVLRQAPLTYEAEFENSYGFTIAVSAANLPDTLIDQLPIAPDSIRLNIQADRESTIDAWGEVTVPSGTYECLREKRVEYQNIAVEAKVGAFPWLDVTSLVSDFLPIVGMDTTTTYQWHNDNEKEIIASVAVQSDGMTGPITYKADPDMMTSVRNVADRSLDILAYPNPAVNHVNIEMMNFPHDLYTLRIFNILGVEIWSDTIEVYRNKTEQIDVSNFNKGTYLYSISNTAGETLVTKRFIVLRP